MNNLTKNANIFFQGKPIKEVFNKNLTNGVSVFTYGGYMVRIAHNKDEYLRLSCSNEELLVELIPIGNEVMSSGVIASYLMDSEDYSELLPTAEWNSNPVRRQRELADNKDLGFKCINLRIYDEYETVTKDQTNVKKLKMGLF